MNKQWLFDYFDRYKKSIFSDAVYGEVLKLSELIKKTSNYGGKIILMGNGASASIASHVAVDLTKAAGIRAINFNEANLITCLANDYGYENWMFKAVEQYSDNGDTVILISSSGNSPNVLKAGEFALTKGLNVVTFSGFVETNPLRSIGQLNFWVDSKSYNVVENTHQIWLLSVCDAIIGTAEYLPS